MKPVFEIPYNQSEELLSWFSNDGLQYLNNIEFIYMTPFVEDYKVKIRSNAYSIPDRNVYEDAVKKLKSLGYNIAFLFTNRHQKISDEMLRYYISLGGTYYIVNDDELALQLKSINRNIKVVASITKQLTLNNLCENDYSIYDTIVLHPAFSASLSSVRQLPTKYRYSIIVNNLCDYTCKLDVHWVEDDFSQCPRVYNGIKNMVYVYPQDLCLFEPYISSYKIQGREDKAEIIINDFLRFYNECEVEHETVIDYYERATDFVKNMPDHIDTVLI